MRDFILIHASKYPSIVTLTMSHSKTKKAVELPVLTITYFQNDVPAMGIDNTDLHLRHRVVKKQNGALPLLHKPSYLLKQKRLLSCRTSLPHTSKNDVPAIGIDNTDLRACSNEKNEIFGSRSPTNPLIA